MTAEIPKKKNLFILPNKGDAGALPE
jgi:hypothetical protein